MRYLVTVFLALACLGVSLGADTATAQNREKVASRGLKKVCPRIKVINPARQFWKNNKPLRSGPQLDAPVIGYFRQMTLAHNKGVRDYNLASAATLYDRKGKFLSRMIPYSCRPDHCGGRVVSQGRTDTSRRLAVRRTGKPTGYVKVSRRLCIRIPDIGRCYGVEVNTSRPLCNQTVG